ncbi:MAG: flagella basal body P-ring formation protein FlgA [Phycisphaerae bacterium]|nr:flagella basal body P-ring formation protein FlgA [Phycisphaerae bacterium]
MALVALAVPSVAVADSIVLRANVKLEGDATHVRLRDVAYLDGESATGLGDTIIAELGGVSSLTLTLDEVRSKLSVHGAKVGLLDFSGKDVTVRSAHADRAAAMRGMAVDDLATPTIAPPPPGPRDEFIADISRSALTPRGLIADLISNAHADKHTPVRLAVEGVDAALLDATDRTRRYEIVPLTSLSADSVRVRIIGREGDTVVSRTDVTVRVTLESQVAVARYAIRRGGSTGGDAVEVATAWVPPSTFGKLVNVEMVGSAIAQANIAKSDRILRDMVRKPIEIKKNDKVTVRRELGTVAIEVAAVADEEGGLGDTIRFFALDRKDRKNRKPFTAVVTGPGRAVIR